MNSNISRVSAGMYFRQENRERRGGLLAVAGWPVKDSLVSTGQAGIHTVLGVVSFDEVD